MRHKNVSALLTLGAAALILVVSATGANAGCIKLQTRGPLICGDWITGSEKCEMLIKGLPAQLADYVWIQCNVLGTQDPYGILDPYDYDFEPFNCDPFTQTCVIIGKARCTNPADFFNDNENAVATAYYLPGPLYAIAETAECSKGGKCTTDATVDPVGNGGVCNNNWDLDFTAYEFIGHICFCPGGLDENEFCCADEGRTDGECETYWNDKYPELAGQVQCLTEKCTYSNRNLSPWDEYNFDPEQFYDCDFYTP
jgi:hypothetical protein